MSAHWLLGLPAKIKEINDKLSGTITGSKLDAIHTGLYTGGAGSGARMTNLDNLDAALSTTAKSKSTMYTTGSSTFTVPAGVYGLEVWCHGSGGGGASGGVSNSTTGAGGGGGGGSGALVKAVVSVTPTQVLTYAVGATGTAGTAVTSGTNANGAAGGAGGASTLSGTLFFISAAGGGGGAAGTGSGGAGGDGGVGGGVGGGTKGTATVNAGAPTVFTEYYTAGAGGGGGGNDDGQPTYASGFNGDGGTKPGTNRSGGPGAGHLWGTGGNGGSGAAGGAPAATSYGAGGGGGAGFYNAAGGTSYAGAAGTRGFVLIIWNS